MIYDKTHLQLKLWRVEKTSDKEEVEYVSTALRQNGYATKNIRGARKIRRREEVLQQPSSYAYLPYISGKEERESTIQYSKLNM